MASKAPVACRNPIDLETNESANIIRPAPSRVKQSWANRQIRVTSGIEWIQTDDFPCGLDGLGSQALAQTQATAAKSLSQNNLHAIHKCADC
jgi:hypothetical protein